MWKNLIATLQSTNLGTARARESSQARLQPARSTRAKLGLENLERRELMAGNVTVELKNGDLVVTGDNSSNSVEIYQTSLDHYKVIGKTEGGSATKINGKVGGSFTFTLNDARYTDDILINMNGGNDVVNIHGSSAEWYDIDAHDEIYITLGSGNDQVYLDNIETTRDLNIDAGSGRDGIMVTNAIISDDLIVTKVGATTSGAIKDSASMVFKNVKVVDDFTITSEKSIDTVNIISSAANDLFISLGTGDDALNLYKSKARNSHSLDGGAGTDKLNLYGNSTAFKTTAFLAPTTINQEWLY